MNDDDEDEKLDLQADWNLLRGRWWPEEVFFIQEGVDGTLSLWRFSCHGEGSQPTHWRVSLQEAIYREAGSVPPTIDVLAKSVSPVSLSEALTQLRDRWRVRNQAWREQAIEFRGKAAELQAKVTNFLRSADSIRKRMEELPPLPKDPLAEESAKPGHTEWLHDNDY